MTDVCAVQGKDAQAKQAASAEETRADHVSERGGGYETWGMAMAMAMSFGVWDLGYGVWGI